MNKAMWMSALLVAGMSSQAVWAADQVVYGRVLSKTPVYTQVTVPQQQCFTQQQMVQTPNTGAGAALGAIAGGVLGNAVGRGAGNAVATGVGVLAGAVVGDRVESQSNPPRMVNTQNCQWVNQTENRLVGYDVVYAYQGQRYSARVPRDPGNRLPLNVQVAPTEAVTAPAAEPAAEAPAPVYAAPQVVYAAPPVVYAPEPAYWGPPVGVRFGWGWGGYHHWR
jgi:uncharacterized protein YcfJ